MSSVMTIDQTAAFDCVMHGILLEKLRLYKLGEKALKWMENYLDGRSQLVNIGRAHSRTVALSRGVPQGSVLGPLLYSVYTNELTECIRDPACRNIVHDDTTRLFDKQCNECGCIEQYADDTTYIISSKIRNHNQQKLEDNLARIQEFLTTNYLTVNTKKTKLTETMIKQKRGRMAGTPPELKITLEDNTEKIIRDEKFCKILGLQIQDNLTWQVHLEAERKALLPEVRKIIGTLKNLGRRIPVGSKNILARGLVLSKLCYLISIWGGGQPPTTEGRHRLL